MKILILSTHSPCYSAGMGQDIMNALINAGHKVDFISKYENLKDKSDYTPIVKKTIFKKLFQNLISKSFRTWLGKQYRKIVPLNVVFKNGYELHYLDEGKPEFNTSAILERISGKYDLVITLWWFSFLNSESIKQIYERVQCPILIYSIDMAPITGGCFYFKECRNFTKECGSCPCLGSKDQNDLTHQNFVLKKENFSHVNVAYLGNSWMNSFAFASGLFDKNKIFNVSCIIDEHEFNIGNQRDARIILGIGDKTFVLLARSSSEIRKGAHHISYAIGNLWNNFNSEKQKSEFVVVTLGDSTIYDDLNAKGIPCLHLGRVDRNKLITAYQSASYFLSASEDDAGPSMVNQSMMCGIPVISFDNGTAMDVVKDGITGFKTREISSKSYATTLRRAYNNSDRNYEIMRKRARETAIEYNSSASFAKKIEEITKQVSSI